MEIIQGDQEHLGKPLPLLSLNHISLVCKSLPLSIHFYEKVMGFERVKRPSSFNFNGAWLFNYGIGIHLLECETMDTHPPKNSIINPRDNHMSFQCTDIILTEKRLKDMEIRYVKQVVEDSGVYIDQLFFHDPDGYMIEICTCENFSVVPLIAAKSSPLRWNDKANINLNMETLKTANRTSEISVTPQLPPLNITADPTQIIFPLSHYEEKEKGVFETKRRCSEEVKAKEEMFFLDILDVFI